MDIQPSPLTNLAKRRFLLDLQEGFSFDSNAIDGDARKVFNLDTFLSDTRVDSPAEVFILAEEFNDFIGLNNYDFIALLTKLWSYTGMYRNRLKNSKSVNIYEPCVNLWEEIQVRDSLWRFLQRLSDRDSWQDFYQFTVNPQESKSPSPLSQMKNLRGDLSGMLSRIKHEISGEAKLDDLARSLLDKINQSWLSLPDLRFQHYSARRFNQLLKICLVQAAARLSTTISCEDIRNANTLLSHTEALMPKAIGEFGKAKNSDVTSKLMEALYTADKPITTQELWKMCSSDLNSIAELANLLAGLTHAEKIQSVGKLGWLPKQMVRKQEPDFVNPVIQEKLR